MLALYDVTRRQPNVLSGMGLSSKETFSMPWRTKDGLLDMVSE